MKKAFHLLVLHLSLYEKENDLELSQTTVTPSFKWCPVLGEISGCSVLMTSLKKNHLTELQQRG